MHFAFSGTSRLQRNARAHPHQGGRRLAPPDVASVRGRASPCTVDRNRCRPRVRDRELHCWRDAAAHLFLWPSGRDWRCMTASIRAAIPPTITTRGSCKNCDAASCQCRKGRCSSAYPSSRRSACDVMLRSILFIGRLLPCLGLRGLRRSRRFGRRRRGRRDKRRDWRCAIGARSDEAALSVDAARIRIDQFKQGGDAACILAFR
jgi:hypothetical protein